MKKNSVRHYACIAMLVFLGFFSHGAQGSEEDFLNVLSENAWNVSCGGDAAGAGNAWAAAYPCNPAMLGYVDSFSANAQYYGRDFGPAWTHSHAEAIIFPTDEYGTVQVSYYDAFSSSAKSNDPQIGIFAIRSISAVSAYYGTKPMKNIFQSGDSMAFGIGYTYYALDVEVNQGSEDEHREKDSDHGTTFGLSYRAKNGVSFGLSYFYLQERMAVIKRNSAREINRGAEQQMRVGVKVPVTEQFELVADYQYLKIRVEEYHDIFAGASYRANDSVSVRAGWAGSGPTIGIGYKPHPDVAIDVATGIAAVSDNEWDRGMSSTVSVFVAF